MRTKDKSFLSYGLAIAGGGMTMARVVDQHAEVDAVNYWPEKKFLEWARGAWDR